MRPSSSLSILPEESQLRGHESPFKSRLGQDFNDAASTAPRALRALARIVDGGLCHRCGSCVGICPTGVLSVDVEEYPKVKNLSACTDCDLCVKVCPGDDFDFEGFYKSVHGREADPTDTHGHFLSAHVAHSTEPFIQEHATSGGLVSQILIHLLETGQIDGAVVIKSSDGPLWKGEPIIARTKEEILSGMKSKYAIVPTNTVLSQIREENGRFACVGLPCQIHGLQKAMALDPKLKAKITLTIGIFCHAAIEHEAFRVIWDTLGEKAKLAKKFISRIGKHPGAPHIELADGSHYPVYYGNRSGYRPTSIEVINVLYRLYTPERCMTCFDALAEFADISVGDPWLPPPEPGVNWYEGWSFAMVRTSRGQDVYRRLVESKSIVSVAVTDKEARMCNKVMSNEKRWRAFRVIETQRRQGKPVPWYGNLSRDLPRHNGKEFIKTEIHMLSHVFCFVPQVRAKVLRFLLTHGYWLFWINNKRRRFKVWLRDSIYRVLSKIRGRT